MSVNDPTATTYTDASGILYYHPTLGYEVAPRTIFEDAGNVNLFYDLSYSLISREVTNVLMKAELVGNEVMTPRIYSYQIRGGDTIRE